MMHPKVLTSVHFHYAHGFYTQTLAQLLDSLVRVSRRVAYNHYANILAEARSSVLVGHIAPGAITLPEGSYIPQGLCLATKTDAGVHAIECTDENIG